MRFSLALAFLLLTATTSLHAQEEDKKDVENIFKVTFLNPGIGYETRVGKFQTIAGHLYLHSSFSYGFSSFGHSSSFAFGPNANFQYRYYYNANARSEKGKPTHLNNLNYVAAVAETGFNKSFFEDDIVGSKGTTNALVNTAGVVWGLQRNYKSRIHLDLNLGLGFLYSTGTKHYEGGTSIPFTEGRITSLNRFTLGFWLNKRK